MVGQSLYLESRTASFESLPVSLAFLDGLTSRATFDFQLVALIKANVKQSLIKHILTEADRIAVGAIYPLESQGGYAVAMNYGMSSVCSSQSDKQDPSLHA